MTVFKDPVTRSIICMGILLVFLFSTIMVLSIQWLSGDLIDTSQLWSWLQQKWH